MGGRTSEIQTLVLSRRQKTTSTTPQTRTPTTIPGFHPPPNTIAASVPEEPAYFTSQTNTPIRNSKNHHELTHTCRMGHSACNTEETQRTPLTNRECDGSPRLASQLTRATPGLGLVCESRPLLEILESVWESLGKFVIGLF